MLLENQTLSNMKTEHFEYMKSKKPDPPPSLEKFCHRKNITSLLVIYPEMYTDIRYTKGSNEYKNHIKFVTGSQEGKIKTWIFGHPEAEQTIQVSNYSILALTFMNYSRRLVVATVD